MTDPLQTGLPAAPEIERYLLAALISGQARHQETFSLLTRDDFSTETHRRIYAALARLWTVGSPLDRAMLMRDLMAAGELESVGGMSYIADLESGMPDVPAVDGYVSIIQQKSLLRKAILNAQALIDTCLDPTAAPEHALERAQLAVEALSTRNGQQASWQTPGDVITGFPGGVEAFLNPSRSGISLKTPWRCLTDVLNGWYAGDLVIVAGRPSMGKTVTGMQIAEYSAVAGAPVAVFSLEMTREALVQRMIASGARVDSHRFRSGTLTADERGRTVRVAGNLAALPLWIDHSRARTAPAMAAALRKLSVKPRIILIDYLQEMRGHTRTENRHHELSAIVHDLKALAQDYEATVILLSQLSRVCEQEHREPHLSDLRESGSIEESADVVTFIHRAERYFPNRPELRGVADFIVAKQRNGPCGTLGMVFLANFQRFEEKCYEQTDYRQEQ